MDHKVLVLNGDYTALALTSVQKAFVLLYLEKADLVAPSSHGVLRTVSREYQRPSVIRLHRYVRVPYKGITLSRHNLMRRDNFECQYCGSTRNLTLDHMLPRSRGGDSGWTNLLTACARCNHKKGDRTPEEAGMPLRQKPRRPTLQSFLKASVGHVEEAWQMYLG